MSESSLPRFSGIVTQCVKCGHNEADTRHFHTRSSFQVERAGIFGAPAQAEFLARECRRCGYSWAEDVVCPRCFGLGLEPVDMAGTPMQAGGIPRACRDCACPAPTVTAAAVLDTEARCGDMNQGDRCELPMHSSGTHRYGGREWAAWDTPVLGARTDTRCSVTSAGGNRCILSDRHWSTSYGALSHRFS